jgi:Tuberculosis necrotizing toxin
VIDRYGATSGKFTSPAGTPFGARSLPPGYDVTAPFNTYRVAQPITGVQAGITAPWFGQPGYGVQYLLPNSVQWLLDEGILEIVQ